jgi:hypothetical protein
MFLPEREKPSFTPTYHKTARQENIRKRKNKFEAVSVEMQEVFTYT